VSESFERATRYFESCKDRNTFLAWLFTIAKNVTRNGIKRKPKVKIESIESPIGKSESGGVDDESAILGEILPDPNVDLLRELLERERYVAIHWLFEQAKTSDLSKYSLWTKMEGMKDTEAAESYNKDRLSIEEKKVTPGTIQVTRSRNRQKIADYIANNELPSPLEWLSR